MTTSLAITAEPIKMLFGEQTHVGPRNRGLYIWPPSGEYN